ncbi:unnamed protein product [Rhodiola kirilowii]
MLRIYAMVGPTYKTNGFGYVFPKGSPLAPDVLRAILNVTQWEKMASIERQFRQLNIHVEQNGGDVKAV